MKSHVRFFVLLCVGLVPCNMVFSAEKISPLKVTKDDTTVTVTGKTAVLTYRFADVPFKPCVKTLCTPSGVNILRDSPHDHIHHHALMFAIAADGTDFWIEFPKRKPGKQVTKGIETKSKTMPCGTSAAVIDAKLDWVANDGTTVMQEKRTITAFDDKDLKPTLMTWQTELAPAEGKESVKLTGSHYFGLGMRFVQSMDKVGRHFNAIGKEGDVVRGTERLASTRWTAYTAPVDGKKVTVAMFCHPSNPRHPARMFTMLQPFSYLSATTNLWKDPMTLKAGKSLDLRYGVAVWDGEVDKDEIEKTYEKWVDLNPK